MILDKGTGYLVVNNRRYSSTSLSYYINPEGRLTLWNNLNDKKVIDFLPYSQLATPSGSFNSKADLDSFFLSSDVGINKVGGGGSSTSGDASAAKQDTGNNSLSSIDTKIPSSINGTIPVSGSVSISNLPATQPVSGTVGINNFPATQAVSATALPLPTGAATSAAQTIGNTSLNSIDSKISTSVKQDTGNTSLASIDSKVATSGKQDTGNTSLSSIDSKVATAANQTSGNTSLSNIDTKLTEKVKTEVTEITNVRSITTGGTSQIASAANASGRYIRIQNLSTEVLWISTTGNAAAFGGDSFSLAGSTNGVGGVFEPVFKITNAVSIIGATAGSKYSIITY